MFEEIKKPLFILEMANNHMGDLNHALEIVRCFGQITAPYRSDFEFAFKLQMRAPTIVHPDFADRMDLKFIKRFTETRLSGDQFRTILDAIRKSGFLAMCTPFDETSVRAVSDIGFDIVKVASCSFADWPLMEAVVQTERPILLSTGGATLETIDQVVSFFQHRDKDFALMHCVTAYPTPLENHQLNQIDLLRQRYDGLAIGFSTHESPADTGLVRLAVAKGCRLFEKHVGLPTEQYSLNAYSAAPEQVEAWLDSAREAFSICGIAGERMPFTEEGEEALQGLMRAVFAKRSIAGGERLTADNTFLAMPSQPGQLLARDLSKYIEHTALEPVPANAPVCRNQMNSIHRRQEVADILCRVVAMLKKARIAVPRNVDCSISAHYGIQRFSEYGVVALNILNREYCKKLLIMLPGQAHPIHRHEVKEETFHVLYGDLAVEMNNQRTDLSQGDLLTVCRGQDHSFSSREGVIIEEISTTHHRDDSYYADPVIMENPDRKIELTIWPDLFETPDTSHD